eukprot:NODE_4945_length_740_cov_3.011577_g4589_i0.p1 GENE.NODE_4945_length_740_cov_3.011577_g4589_i0~~NODE_4945_length_740_cov_3.011577_g4589_i0.p1  ORF type:complete len:196 (+),score=44.47 NODE_4945_length_740_cov_3.011577_g4589_i0:74-661(+)
MTSLHVAPSADDIDRQNKFAQVLVNLGIATPEELWPQKASQSPQPPQPPQQSVAVSPVLTQAEKKSTSPPADVQAAAPVRTVPTVPLSLPISNEPTSTAQSALDEIRQNIGIVVSDFGAIWEYNAHNLEAVKDPKSLVVSPYLTNLRACYKSKRNDCESELNEASSLLSSHLTRFAQMASERWQLERSRLKSELE